jgi:DNA-binding transcriptional regulator YhcF (GntR family)
MFVTKRNGTQELVKFDNITTRIKKLIKPDEIGKVDPILITQKVIATIYSGINTTEVDLQSAEICINLSTQHHLYSNLAGRILVSNLHKKTTSHFVDKMVTIQKSLGILDEKWMNWLKKNKKEINAMVDYERDYLFDYFGFKTLERAYLLKIKDEIIDELKTENLLEEVKKEAIEEIKSRHLSAEDEKKAIDEVNNQDLTEESIENELIEQLDNNDEMVINLLKNES